MSSTTYIHTEVTGGMGEGEGQARGKEGRRRRTTLLTLGSEDEEEGTLDWEETMETFFLHCYGREITTLTLDLLGTLSL